MWLTSPVLLTLFHLLPLSFFFPFPHHTASSLLIYTSCLSRKKYSFAMLTSMENTVTEGRRKVKASEIFFDIWLRGLRLPDSARLFSVFQAVCHRILLMRRNKCKPIFVYFSLYFTQSLWRRTGKLSANILSKQTE